jgi:electron transfer flavoprotein alpha subunit
MKSVLLLIHTMEDGGMGKAALEALSAVKVLAEGLGGAEIKAGLVGRQVQSAAELLAGAGIQSIYTVTGEGYELSRYSTDAAALSAIVKAVDPDIVLVPGTTRMSRCIPGVAHRTGGSIDTHISGLGPGADGLKVKRWYYRQRMEAVLSRDQKPWFLLLSTGVYPVYSASAATEASPNLLEVEVGDLGTRTSVIGVEEAVVGAQTIKPEAEILFVAGAGWPKKQADGQTHLDDAEQLILGFLEKANASLGSTKSLVDQSGEGQAVLSFMTHMNQVGQTGSTPRHPKGLATCCHGEEPHVVGWRFINQRRAINLDPNCGWAQGKADVLYIADAFSLMKKVNELL